MGKLEVFHAGERAVQKMAGETTMANLNGRIISDLIVNGARAFIERQTMVFISTQDENGQVWTTVLTGSAGFVTSPSSSELIISIAEGMPVPKGLQQVQDTAQVGMLFIELATRRRIRVNGVARRESGRLYIEVEEAYPNCPKYIQRRTVRELTGLSGGDVEWQEGTSLTQGVGQMIAQADTLFIGSVSQSGRLDVSHRGGPEGFVEMTPEGALKVPDYQGNSMFNTLGNIQEDPRTGLLFIDFEEGTLLQLTGEASLLFQQESEEDLKKTTGTGRYWVYKIKGWRMLQGQASLKMDFIDASPFNPQWV
ncbi:MAG TPA: pyridoxamine 5'-phosphate oxidase [Cytophagales bacterium]|nr:pyridoxamine 5'-phosphate oxidase [Cytophagales bacterium]HAP63282.1 pyridoxamine 5'-phosphate oxidase [Cytophagales bacterium]